MSRHDSIRSRITHVTEILVQRKMAMKESIVGCSAQEIDEIEAAVGRRLPLAYREFLAQMGHGAGDFYMGTDIFYPRLHGLGQAARDLVAEEKSNLALPNEAIVFMMHQGYQFLFVRNDEGDDPPVYYYMEFSGQFVKKSDHLTDFLIDVAHNDW